MSGDPFWQAITAQGLALPEEIVRFHAGAGSKTYRGRCAIIHGSHWAAAFMRRLARFPPAGDDVPVELRLDITPEGAVWHRSFDGHSTRSDLRWEARRGLVSERFGPFRVDLALTAKDSALHVEIKRVRVLGLPLPSWLRPQSQTREFVNETGGFCFDVSGTLPGIGLLIRYHGWLNRVSTDT